MKPPMIMLAVLLLGGCASTPAGLENRPVAFSENSDKTVDDYVRCVMPKMVSLAANTHVIPTENGQRIIVDGGGFAPQVMAVGDVEASKQGSSVVVREHQHIGGYDDIEGVFKKCL